jgi:hypothetical protein
MQVVVQVVCSRGPSVRDLISKDRGLEGGNLKVAEQRRSGRPRGWTKLHSTLPNTRGAINIEWDSDTSILLCRVVNRGKARPNLIIGDFVDYLLERFRRRIQAINIIPRS